jgi:type VI secretion system protein VasD
MDRKKACGIISALLALTFAGCATSVGEAVGNAGSSALKAVGIGKESSVPRPIHLQIHAGENVNSDKAGQGFAVVLRTYALRNAENFERTPRSALEAGTPVNLKDDVLAVREQILTPGQQYRLEVALPPGADYLGIAVMFQSGQPTRWRSVLPASAIRDALTLGVHRCSFTVTDGIKDKDLQASLSMAGSATCN